MDCNKEVAVSVIIPVYNGEKSLQGLVKKLNRQTMQDMQVILVNDGSTDKTAEICQQLLAKDDRIEYIEKENGGAGSARNAGIEIARGKYLYFLDADDEIADNLLEKAVTTAEENAADLVVFALERRIINSQSGQVEWVTTSTQTDGQYSSSKEFRRAFCSLYYGGTLFGGPVNKLFLRKTVMDSGVRFPDLRRGQDEIFNLLYYSHVHRAAVIPDLLYFYNAYDTAAKNRKYRLDYFEKTTLTYYQVFGELLKEFGVEEPIWLEKYRHSFVYALENGFCLAFNPVENLNRKQKIAHIQRLLGFDLVKQYVADINKVPDGYDRFWALVKGNFAKKIYRFLAWGELKNKLKKLLGK